MSLTVISVHQAVAFLIRLVPNLNLFRGMAPRPRSFIRAGLIVLLAILSWVVAFGVETIFLELQPIIAEDFDMCAFTHGMQSFLIFALTFVEKMIDKVQLLHYSNRRS